MFCVKVCAEASITFLQEGHNVSWVINAACAIMLYDVCWGMTSNRLVNRQKAYLPQFWLKVLFQTKMAKIFSRSIWIHPSPYLSVLQVGCPHSSGIEGQAELLGPRPSNQRCFRGALQTRLMRNLPERLVTAVTFLYLSFESLFQTKCRLNAVRVLLERRRTEYVVVHHTAITCLHISSSPRVRRSSLTSVASFRLEEQNRRCMMLSERKKQ